MLLVSGKNSERQAADCSFMYVMTARYIAVFGVHIDRKRIINSLWIIRGYGLNSYGWVKVCIFNFGVMWTNNRLHVPATLTRFLKKLAASQSRAGRVEEDMAFLPCISVPKFGPVLYSVRKFLHADTITQSLGTIENRILLEKVLKEANFHSERKSISERQATQYVTPSPSLPEQNRFRKKYASVKIL